MLFAVLSTAAAAASPALQPSDALASAAGPIDLSHGNCNNIYTSCCRHDGFGEHFLAMIIAYGYSRAVNATYCVTPWNEFGGIAHLGGKHDALALWEFVGGSHYGPDCRALSGKLKQTSCWNQGANSYGCRATPERPMLAKSVCRPGSMTAMGASAAGIPRGVAPWAMSWENGVDEFHSRVSKQQWYHSKMEARKKYLAATPKPNLRFFTADKTKRHLAVHVRRGDLLSKAGQSHVKRKRPVESAAKEIACIKQALQSMGAAKKITVHIFSEGSASYFDAHKRALHGTSAGVQVHVDESDPRYDLREAFHHMVMADGLLIAESALSASAGLLRERHTYHFCNRPMKGAQIEPGLGWP